MTVPLAYEDKGTATGVPLLLVHGHPFDHTMWDPQIEAFAPHRRVVAPDLRGYGASPVVPGITPLAAFAADLEALLDELGLESVILAGLSMGGQIAMECYDRFGDRIRGLVLADTFAEPETPEGRRTRSAMADGLLREGMRGYADGDLHDGRPLRRAGRPGPRPPHDDRRPARGGRRGPARTRRTPRYRPLLARVTVPALVVVGEDDEYTLVPVAETLHALLPESTLHVVKDAAHMPNLERPDEFNAALAAFLDRIPG
ncbi:Hydrolase OS=Streptomyces glaucescens OX=1907 GN=SGLAU_17720 PE=4 SV=1 [Streptomyces glaucescens]